MSKSKYFFAACGTILFLSAAFPAYASSLTAAQISAVVSLLQSFGVPQSTVSNVQSVLQGQTPSGCTTITNGLSLGKTDAMTGGDVSRVQRFLGVEVTGYFGQSTQKAVGQWQAVHGVVQLGESGYGGVGPLTRAAIGRACMQNNTGPKPAPPSSLQPFCPLVALPIGKVCTGSWKEVKDAKGCTASWECTQ